VISANDVDVEREQLYREYYSCRDYAGFLKLGYAIQSSLPVTRWLSPFKGMLGKLEASRGQEGAAEAT
jgi:hypothetical protein